MQEQVAAKEEVPSYSGIGTRILSGTVKLLVSTLVFHIEIHIQLVDSAGRPGISSVL